MNSNFSTNKKIGDLSSEQSGFFSSMSLQSMIDNNPLMVSPQICLIEVLKLMAQINDYAHISANVTTNLPRKISCILVVENNTLIGLLTEGDLVKLIVDNIDFQEVTVEQVMIRNLITLKQSQLEDIFIPLNLCRQYKIRHIPILNDENQVMGLISTESICQNLPAIDLLKLRQIQEIMTSNVISVSPETSLLKITELLIQHNISSVVITEKNNSQIPLGLITKSDLVQAKIRGLNFASLGANSLINSPLFYLTPEHYLGDAQQEMQQRKVNHLIICNESGKLAGIINYNNILQILNPGELFLFINTLQKKVSFLEAEKQVKIKNSGALSSESKKIISILLVEDSRTEAKIITKILTNKNPFISQTSLTHVLTLQAALMELKINNFEVIILDLNLPDSNDLNTLLTVRKHCPDVPIVVLTSTVTNNLDFSLQCLHYGAQDYLAKDDYLSNLGSNQQLLIRAIYYAIERKNIEKKLQKINYEYNLTNQKLQQQLEEHNEIQKSLNNLTNQLEIEVKSKVTNLKEVCEQLGSEVKKRQKIEEVLRFIVEGVYEVKGENFFQSLVKYIPQSLEVDHVIIGELINNNKIKTIANYANGKIVDNIEYDLANTPSENVIKTKTFSVYKNNLQQLFPHGLIVQKIKAESYLGIPLLDSQGQVLGVLVALKLNPLQDIELKKEIMELFATRISSELERQKIEKSLQDQTQLLNTVINTANEGITLNNLEGKFLLYNPAMSEISGYSLSEANNYENYLAYLYPKVINTQAKLLDEKAINNQETTIKTKSGELKTLLVSNSLIKLKNEELWLSIYRDITERVKYEQALKTLNQELEIRVEKRTVELQATTLRLTSLMENLQHGVLLKDENNQVILINQAFCDIFDIDEHPGNLIGADFSSFIDIYDDYFKSDFHQHYLDIIQNQKMIINEEIEFQNGRIFEVDYIPLMLNNIYSGHFWMYREVTQRKNYEINLENLAQELQYTNQQLSDFQAALDQAAIVAITDPKGVITYVNNNFCEISQHRRKDVIGNNANILNSGYHSRQFWQDFWQTISQGNIWRGEIKNRKKDGTFYWVDTVVIPFLNINNKPWQYVAIRYDITAKKEAENSLKEKFAILEATIDGIAILKDEKYTYLNQSHLNIFGYENSSELIGKSWRELYSPQEIRRFETEVFPILGQEKYWQGEAIAIKKDGSIILEDVSLTLMDDDTLICICRDITERKKTETELNNYFNLSLDLICISDFNGQFKRLNPAWENTLGYEIGELTNHRFIDFVHREDQDKTNAVMAKLIISESPYKVSEFENRYRCKNSEYKWISWNCISAPESRLIYAVARDITERKNIEIALKKSLEKEQELNELKSRFITMTSHEFRTPLAVISSSVGILKTFNHKLSEAQKQEHLNTIQTYIKHTTSLLDDILLLNRVETGKESFNPTYFNLPEFCQSLIQDLQITTEKHNLIFSLEPENMGIKPTVYLDIKLIRQMLVNVLTNSIKYSPNGGNINLNLIMEHNKVIFNIKDCGIGIAPEDQKHLFDSFHRGTNVGTIQGTGLGLTIVKKSLELHGGTITFESKINEGSTFIITIPFDN